MQRYQQDKKIIKRELRRRKMVTSGSNDRWVAQPGRFRKTDAFDCGHTGCCQCHYEKIYQIKNMHQKKADVSAKEQYREAS